MPSLSPMLSTWPISISEVAISPATQSLRGSVKASAWLRAPLSCVVLLALSNPVQARWYDEPEGYSGYGRWYLSLSGESGTAEQNLTDSGSFSFNAPRIAVGGVGPEAVRFEFAWLRVTDADENWRTSGVEAEFWLPWMPERRIRPYLILGGGYYQYYGEQSDFFDQEGADNTARSFNAGFAVTGNVTLTTEVSLSVHYRMLEWDAGEEGTAADASLTSARLSLSRLF